ncbi:hypothetical protein D770_23875 [Flammeovirgaceae bacterium 311]|nr:hypothetical protein D770_23875 [Flammeovirgaceae bacterium 311]
MLAALVTAPLLKSVWVIDAFSLLSPEGIFRPVLCNTTSARLPAEVLVSAFSPANKLNHLPEMVQKTTYMTCKKWDVPFGMKIFKEKQ